MARVTRVTRQAQQEDLLTLARAKVLTNGTTLYHVTDRNADGTATRVKVTSVQTWKTRPGEVCVRWKYGLYVYGTTFADGLEDWTLNDLTREAPQTSVTQEEIERYLPYI